MVRTDSAAYIDPVYAVCDELSRLGVKPSAVAEESHNVSQGIISKHWFHIEGEPIFKADDKPAIDVPTYCRELIKRKPHIIWVEHIVDEADLTFIGDGKKRTLKDAGDFVKKYGEKVYNETKLAYGCDDTLRAGTKPGPKDNKPKQADRGNPYNEGGDPARRMERIIALVKSNATLATSLAKSAGMRLDGTPIPKR